jgi:hypothetical protein
MATSRKKKVTQGDIARVCKVDQGSVSRILNKDTRDSFSPETIQKVFQAAREIGYVHPALVSTNRRHSPRKKAAIRANVSLLIGSNTLYDRGTCEIHEMSGSGMLLKNFQTRKGTLPLDRFRIDLQVTGGPLRGVEARTHLVRFSNHQSEFAIAVAYEQLDDGARRRIARYLKLGKAGK